jgi:hypothetical protein
MNWFRCGFPGIAGAVARTTAGLELNGRGNAGYGRGHYAAAERPHNQAVQAWRALGPGYQAHVAASLVNLGSDLCAEGRRRQGGGSL